MALLRKTTCNLRHYTGLGHPVHDVDVFYITCRCNWRCIFTLYFYKYIHVAHTVACVIHRNLDDAYPHHIAPTFTHSPLCTPHQVCILWNACVPKQKQTKTSGKLWSCVPWNNGNKNLVASLAACRVKIRILGNCLLTATKSTRLSRPFCCVSMLLFFPLLLGLVYDLEKYVNVCA